MDDRIWTLLPARGKVFTHPGKGTPSHRGVVRFSNKFLRAQPRLQIGDAVNRNLERSSSKDNGPGKLAHGGSQVNAATFHDA
ncbi:hypothetical protein GCM10009611_12330 [Arthrobacter roseus]